jgi:tRNA A37 threonylcarbamoyladenosine dehydratase
MSADSRAAPPAFALGAAIGAATAAAATYYYCSSSSSARRASGPGAGAAAGAAAAAKAANAAPPLPFSNENAALLPFPNASLNTTTITVRDHHSTDDILREQLSRNRQFFAATDGQQRLAQSFVVVVGLGGVGSHAAHMLLRAGVGRLRLVDFDQVSLSSLSRHATATRADVGLPKTEALARRLRKILPEAQVEALNEMFTADSAERVLGGWRGGAGPGGGGGSGGGAGDDNNPDNNPNSNQKPDFVVDAIDNIHTKVDLIAGCRARGIEILCCAGAGAKADPTRVRFADLSESAYDPLARAVRKRLRRAHGFGEGVTLLLSTEAPRCALVAACEEEEGGGGAAGAAAVSEAQAAAALARAAAEAARASAAAEVAAVAGGGGAARPPTPADASVAVEEEAEEGGGLEADKAAIAATANKTTTTTNPLADYQLVPNFRVRIIPVLGTTPAVFGQAAAAHVLCRLAGAPFDGEPLALYTSAQYSRAEDRLADRERRRFGTTEGVSVDHDDVVYLMRELWRGYSARLGEKGRVAAAVGGTRGLMRATAGLEFTRWDASRPATLDNLVLLTSEEADAHDRLFDGGDGGGEEGQKRVVSAEAADAALAALRARDPAYVAHVEAMLERARWDHWRVQLA